MADEVPSTTSVGPSLVLVERALAVDPGKTTGLAVLERMRLSDGAHTVRLLYSGETEPDQTIPRIRELHERYGAPVETPRPSPRMRFVVESFKITAGTAKLSQDVTHALRTIGAVEQACRDLGYPVEAIKWFNPDQKKAFPNERLRRLGLWHVGGDGHALDAIRHGTLYLSQTGVMEANARAVSGPASGG